MNDARQRLLTLVKAKHSIEQIERRRLGSLGAGSGGDWSGPAILGGRRLAEGIMIFCRSMPEPAASLTYASRRDPQAACG